MTRECSGSTGADSENEEKKSENHRSRSHSHSVFVPGAGVEPALR